ncbi:hypothetical protein SAMN05216474_0964 [Lishizhenia tianjinensis]|uniref:Lipoprotein n=1 Tax=Lishizhenia tianjinensis TaxID=477690 RepID=A0A1I6YK56_9FLAO|nr:hypothetical protein [Lishizhenia tianjinensis]SFT50855.1 hypothetical protein SAMN05216474_0964 [Lishizhenia tianjinensis]
MKVLLFLVMSIALLACGNAKKSASEKMSTPKAILGEIDQNAPTAQINSVRIEGNLMFLEVSYSGGCEEQAFTLIGSNMIMKSLPPKRGIRLQRDPKGDACRELVSKSLVFDISNLAYKQEAGSEIVLLLDGYKEEVKYTFTQE